MGLVVPGSDKNWRDHPAETHEKPMDFLEEGQECTRKKRRIMSSPSNKIIIYCWFSLAMMLVFGGVSFS